VIFDTGRAEIKPEARKLLEAEARWLQAHPDVHLRIEGYADERGTAAYNRALGQRRAVAVRDFLVARGVRSSRLGVVTYGESRPLCTEPTTACLTRNRRVHLAAPAPGRAAAEPGAAAVTSSPARLEVATPSSPPSRP
jgi:peptidoglycan-associated lipoprotein